MSVFPQSPLQQWLPSRVENLQRRWFLHPMTCLFIKYKGFKWKRLKQIHLSFTYRFYIFLGQILNVDEYQIWFCDFWTKDEFSLNFGSLN
jgi:hypothetical protein